MSVAQIPSLLLFAALSMSLSACYGGCGPEDGAPDPDLCDSGASGNLAATEVGQLDGSGEFVPLEDGMLVSVSTGGQGTDMIALRYRAMGANIACIPQRTVLHGTGEDIVSEHNLRAYDDGEWKITDNHFIVLPFVQSPETMTIDAQVGSELHQYEVLIREPPPPPGPDDLPDITSLGPPSEPLMVGFADLVVNFDAPLPAPVTVKATSSDGAILSAAPVTLDDTETGLRSVEVSLAIKQTGTVTVTVWLGDSSESIELTVVDS